MKRCIAVCRIVGVAAVGVAVFLGMAASPATAQKRVEGVFNGHRIIYPASSIPVPGHFHTNYFFVDSDQMQQGGPPSGVESPGSLACVYQLVTGPTGCPVATSTTLPTGGWGAIAIVDAGYYPTAASDLATFSSYYGIPAADFTQVWVGKKQPPTYSDWEVEEALDIEWAHAMAPQAKLYLVVSKLCTTDCATDPTWSAIALATKLVKAAGGGVVSMSFGDSEGTYELSHDKSFKNKNVVYFAASGDGGLGVRFIRDRLLMLSPSAVRISTVMAAASSSPSSGTPAAVAATSVRSSRARPTRMASRPSSERSAGIRTSRRTSAAPASWLGEAGLRWGGLAGPRRPWPAS